MIEVPLKFNGISKQFELKNMMNDYRVICFKEIARLNAVILFFKKAIRLYDKTEKTGFAEFEEEYLKLLNKRLTAMVEFDTEITMILHKYRCLSCDELMNKILDKIKEVNKNE